MNAPFSLGSESVTLADLRDPGEAARIEAFVTDAGGSLFHRPAWLRAVERGTRQPGLGLVTERGGSITGWLPLTQVHSPFFGRRLVSSGFGVGGGALAESSASGERLCRAAEELAARLSCPTVELRGGVFPRDWSTRVESHCNFARPLAATDETELLAIPRRQRAEVRKSLAAEFEVNVGSGAADRAALYTCYAQSVRNLGTPVFPRSLFDAMLDQFGEDADIVTIRHHGAPVSSVLSFYHRGTVMPYWGGGTFAARRLRANDRTYYELMLHARRRGCTRFDFGRSKTGSGAYHFKKNWGFEPEPLAYGSWTAAGHAKRNIDPTDEAYSAPIDLWKRLPLPLANRLGPTIARGLA